MPHRWIPSLCFLCRPDRSLMPESWLLPERIAARVLRMDRKSTGIRLFQIVAPEQWNDIARGYRVVTKNRAAIAKREDMASKRSHPVPCVVEIWKSN